MNLIDFVVAVSLVIVAISVIYFFTFFIFAQSLQFTDIMADGPHFPNICFPSNEYFLFFSYHLINCIDWICTHFVYVFTFRLHSNFDEWINKAYVFSNRVDTVN